MFSRVSSVAVFWKSFSEIVNHFFQPRSNRSNSIQICMCPEHNSLMSNLQQAASSFSTAAVREEATAHYIRPNVPILL